MFARLGGIELFAVCSVYFRNNLHPVTRKIIKHTGIIDLENYSGRGGVFNRLHMNAGFFPVNAASISGFYDLMLDLNILASWLPNERFFIKNLQHAAVCRLSDMDPVYSGYPWSAALQGKKILVVHPFKTTIENQYKKRELLFENNNILPDFHLEVVKAVQSNGGAETKFGNWFEALDCMTDEIAKKDFDVAILGCGAYGFPLASRIKRMGKVAIHPGGATQLLFGIKGKRWDSRPEYVKIYNQHWVRPGDDEKPPQHAMVEGSCYW